MKTQAEKQTEEEVERLFRGLSPGFCENPVTGRQFMMGLDPIRPEKRMAGRALQAREWFAEYGPRHLQPLPLAPNEREALRHSDPEQFILAKYARSVASLQYAIKDHPSFNDFASGVMASDHAPAFITNDSALLRTYPPRPLKGLECGLYWRAAQGHPRMPHHRVLRLVPPDENVKRTKANRNRCHVATG